MSRVAKRQSRKRSPGTSTKEQQLVEAQRLNRWADVLLGIPVGSNLPPKTPMPEFWISDQERSSIAWYLHRLAQTPKALTMIEIPKPRPDRRRRVKNETIMLLSIIKLTNCGWP